MFKKFALLLVVFLCAACEKEAATLEAPVVAAQPVGSGHTLVHNVQIYTRDLGLSTADSMVFDADGEVKFVGNLEPKMEMFQDAQLIDKG